MSDNSRVQCLLDELGTLLISWTKDGGSMQTAAQLVDVYWRFMTVVHHDLVLKEAQGAALATASCIPIWEMLHFHSGSFAPLRGASKAFVISLLTSLYPKTRDRRCLFQHTGCIGCLGFPRVPLGNRLPMLTEVIKYQDNGSAELSLYREVVEYVRNTVEAEEQILQDSTFKCLKEKAKILVENVLPRCHLVMALSDVTSTTAASGDKFVIPLNGEVLSGICSYNVLRETLWKYLILLHVYIPDDGRTLGNYLTVSTWSQRVVRLPDNSEFTYATLMNPLVQEAAVCASLMLPVTNEVSDNTPLISPHLLGVLLPSSKEALPGVSSVCQENLKEAFVPIRLSKRNASMIHSTGANLREQLEECIPQEIAMFEESSSCRDCDKLTQLCRGVVLSPVTQCGGSNGVSISVMKRMLFNRKRNRDDGFYEGPALLPVVSSLGEMLLEKPIKKCLSTLERITATSAST